MDFKSFMAAAHAALDAGEVLAKTASALGIPGVSTAAAVAVAVADVAKNLMARAEDGALALSLTDKLQLQALVEKLDGIANQEEAAADAAENEALK